MTEKELETKLNELNRRGYFLEAATRRIEQKLEWQIRLGLLNNRFLIGVVIALLVYHIFWK
jgi:hypothetical protein